MNGNLGDDQLESWCRNAAYAVAAGFTTFTLAMWGRTGEVDPTFLVAAVLLWMVLLVVGDPPSHEPS
ncbi:hypothetical protein [Nocardioides sp. 616]|uniref:hypothetical protein n=1 Tax=Nocardioides sp. 616 TaxID=2268090 RepID=UPI000CE56107|nr:hypothetical protein [Nocardioides sp. 616]